MGLDNDNLDNPARRRIERLYSEKVLNLWFSLKDLNEAFCKGEEVLKFRSLIF